MSIKLVLAGSICMLLGIIIGASSTHFLVDVFTGSQIISVDTALKYQYYHGLAFLILGLHYQRIPFRYIYTLMLVAITLFSFSIYILVVLGHFGLHIFGFWILTPLGGSMLIISWLWFIIKVVQNRKIIFDN